MAKRKTHRSRGEAAKLEMTPMIDVVFQLLIFFIVTLQEQDILAQLNVSRPAPDQQATPDQSPDLLTIEVGSDQWVLNGRPFSRGQLPQLDRQLSRLASFSKDASVIIKCTADSPHGALIQILNILSREGMQNISVFSL